MALCPQILRRFILLIDRASATRAKPITVGGQRFRMLAEHQAALQKSNSKNDSTAEKNIIPRTIHSGQVGLIKLGQISQRDSAKGIAAMMIPRTAQVE